MSALYTPVVFEVTPAVVYYNHEASIVIDPRKADDFSKAGSAFKEARIDSYMMDFEDYSVDIGSYS